MKIVESFQTDLLTTLGLAPDAWNTAGVSVVPTEARADTGSASGYVLGEHFVIWCDPAVAERVSAFATSGETDPIEQYMAFGASVGAEFVGGGVIRVLPPEAAPNDPEGVISIDRDNAEEKQRLLAFLDGCDPDDLDEADIYVDSLDSLIRCTETSPEGSLTAYASALPFEHATRWWDIGVLTPVEYRQQGLGTRCVQAVIAQTLADGNQPLYRHNVDNLNSGRLADGLGFVLAARLAAISFG